MADDLFPAVGTRVEFPQVLGGERRMIKATVVDDPRSDSRRVAIQPDGYSISGRKPAVRLRTRAKLVPLI